MYSLRLVFLSLTIAIGSAVVEREESAASSTDVANTVLPDVSTESVSVYTTDEVHAATADAETVTETATVFSTETVTSTTFAPESSVTTEAAPRTSFNFDYERFRRHADALAELYRMENRRNRDTSTED